MRINGLTEREELLARVISLVLDMTEKEKQIRGLPGIGHDDDHQRDMKLKQGILDDARFMSDLIGRLAR